MHDVQMATLRVIFVGQPNPKFSVIMIDDSLHILMSQSSCTLTWNKNLFTKFNPRGSLKKCPADKHMKSRSLEDILSKVSGREGVKMNSSGVL